MLPIYKENLFCFNFEPLVKTIISQRWLKIIKEDFLEDVKKLDEM